jgi:hypothetical protein
MRTSQFPLSIAPLHSLPISGKKKGYSNERLQIMRQDRSLERARSRIRYIKGNLRLMQKQNSESRYREGQ